ncbi:ShlB/FhaC/HecB family hemolysin secretion/activation protein, partial [Pseudomonas aeruginosa]|uniref:ShlB/FhaC/HecB family hemolysin secretion/activation protein n=1 Tax=Pseudomonas aeruginosa TaxID=287 RepID=UPI0015E8A9E1
VVEGRLEGLDSSALASPRELAMSFPGRTGELLDLRELEQLVDQLSRLPSRQAQLELVPGSEVGGSRVRLKGERDKPADASGDDERCFEIRRIELEGAGHLGESARRQLLAPYQGRCLGVGQLNALLKAVTDHYLDRGYVTTRAYLPQQDLASGTLRIIVVEGRLEGLDSSALASPRELAMSFPGRTGELLDLRELEQLVDQLSRLPSRQAQLELVPGSEVGGSRVRLKGERDKPWRVSATRNNDGDVSTGEQQMGLGLDWDSPLGLADQLNLRANRDAVTDRWRHSDSQ